MHHNIRVLLIEDEPDDALRIGLYLNEACGDRVKQDLESARTLAAGLGLLAAKEFDIILLDLDLPDSRGLDGLKLLHDKAPGVPVVVLTDLDRAEAGLTAIDAGA